LSLSVTLRDREDRYALSLFVKNVLDKNFYIDMGDDDYWSSPAYFGTLNRPGFRGGYSVRVKQPVVQRC